MQRFIKMCFFVSILLSGTTLIQDQTTEIVFDVYFNDNLIGTVSAIKKINGTKIVEDLKTNTNSKILMLEVHVESEINVTIENNSLVKGVAYRHSNRGNEDVESTVLKVDKKSYSIDRKGKKQIVKVSSIDFCVIDLYFKEPMGRNAVFSNMYGQFITILPKGNGKYETILPDGKTALYMYKNGKLETIQVEMSMGKIISKRRH